MNSDDPFDREVRATLDGMAGGPAPDRLVASVAAIPGEVPTAAPGRPPIRGIVSGLAAIAAVVALAVAAVVLRPGVVPQTGDASASPTQGVPSSEPTPAPSALVLVPTPTASLTPTPTPTATAGDPVPASFRPISVTFVSSAQGWVLGSAPCAAGRCPAIAHTLDGGKSWSSIPAPKTSIGAGPAVDVSGTGITGLRFADVNDGWAFGPELWTTHDGGTTWKRLDPFAGGPVVALASGHGTVHAVAYNGDHNFHIASAPVAGDGWTVSSLDIPVGGGPVPVIQLVLSGAAGWVLENDRTVVTGARLVAGTWRAWNPPCADVVGPAYIDASSTDDMVAACDVGAWSTPKGGHLYVSHDGGVSFAATGPRIPFQIESAVARPDTTTIILAGSDTKETVLEASYDGGHSWAIVHHAGAVGLTDLGFTTTTQGVVIATANGSSHLLMTRDGGHTWAAVHF